MVLGVMEQHALKNMSSYGYTIDIERRKNRLFKFCYVPATSAAHKSLLFFLFLLQAFTVLMKQTRQAVRAIKQSIFLDVYGEYQNFLLLGDIWWSKFCSINKCCLFVQHHG